VKYKHHIATDKRKVDYWKSEVITFVINKTDRQDIAEILLKVALNTINQTKTKPGFTCTTGMI
jgi:transposase-like protein